MREFIEEDLNRSKRQNRRETARQTKAESAAMEAAGYDFELEEAEEGVESLFADGKMKIKPWLDRYYKTVESSDRSEAFTTGDKLRDFTAGTIISERVASDIEHFFDTDEKIFASERENGTRVDFNVISEKLEITIEEAIKLVALVSLKDAGHTVKMLFDYRDDPDWDFLNKHVSKKEFAALQKLFKNADFVDRLITELLRQNADVIQKTMPAKSMDSFISIHLKANSYIDQSESRVLFGTDAVKQKYASLFEKEGIEAINYVDGYEFLFGEFSKDEFLKFFPNWHEAEWFRYYTYERRFRLEKPLEKSAEVADKTAEMSSDDKQPEEVGDDKTEMSGRVVVLEESRILKFFDKKEEAGIAGYIAPYTQAAEKEGHFLTSSDFRGRAKSDVYVYTPYERDANKYMEAVSGARERMERETGLKERLRIFFADLWPQMLIARADEVADDKLIGEVQKAIGLLQAEGGMLSEHLSVLSRLSRDPKANKGEIEILAAKLRNDKTLHENGTYVHTEVIYRQRSREAGKEGVYLLSGISFEIDETHEFDVDGTKTKVHELGDRIDTLNLDAPGLGFTYAGDNHGVVLKGVIRETSNRDLLPYLNDDTEYLVGAGEKLHPLSGGIQEAIRRDYPKNPSEKQVQAVYRSRYKSTRDHERQHKEDEVRGVQYGMPPVTRRVAQETTAYLRSMAGRSEDREPNAPFANLASLIQLYISRSTNPFSAIEDPHRIYEKATGRILRLLSDKLSGVEVDTKALKEHPLEACQRVLEGALKLDRNGLRDLTAQILDEEIVRQKTTHSLSDLDPVQTYRPAEPATPGTAKSKTGTKQSKENVFEITPGRMASGMSHNIDTTIPTSGNPETDLSDKKKVRRSLRGAVFSAILLATSFFLKGDGQERAKAGPSVADDIEMPAKADGDTSDESDNEFRIVSSEYDEPAVIGLAGGGALPVVKSTAKEDFGIPGLEHIPTEAERKSFGRGVWGYAESVLQSRGLRRDSDKEYAQKVAELTNIFLGVLEGEGILKRDKGVTTWYVSVSGSGIDRIIGILRAEVPDDVIGSFVGSDDREKRTES